MSEEPSRASVAPLFTVTVPEPKPLLDAEASTPFAMVTLPEKVLLPVSNNVPTPSLVKLVKLLITPSSSLLLPALLIVNP